MEREICKYFMKRLKEEKIQILPGHYPELKTKEEVDKWISIIKKSFEDFFKGKGGEENE
ncbi:hypothetical protein [Thermoanaerobacter sp. YS13]|uniref:hypothetical protein n=1 Tax=Thermoanaerobacter sp. YS13 TaxID=1511746 RepID=UPI000AC115E3|nr:hypothetical protein [Thermoanaerobacter sp. YS13]